MFGHRNTDICLPDNVAATNLIICSTLRACLSPLSSTMKSWAGGLHRRHQPVDCPVARDARTLAKQRSEFYEDDEMRRTVGRDPGGWPYGSARPRPGEHQRPDRRARPSSCAGSANDDLDAGASDVHEIGRAHV